MGLCVLCVFRVGVRLGGWVVKLSNMGAAHGKQYCPRLFLASTALRPAPPPHSAHSASRPPLLPPPYRLPDDPKNASVLCGTTWGIPATWRISRERCDGEPGGGWHARRDLGGVSEGHGAGRKRAREGTCDARPHRQDRALRFVLARCERDQKKEGCRNGRTTRPLSANPPPWHTAIVSFAKVPPGTAQLVKQTSLPEDFDSFLYTSPA